MLRKKSPHLLDIETGQRIRARRLLLGMSQERLAALAGGVSFQQFQKYENGTNRVSASRLILIARALDCPASVLLPGAGATDGEALPGLDAARAALAEGFAAMRLAEDRLQQAAEEHARATAAFLKSSRLLGIEPSLLGDLSLTAAAAASELRQ